MSEIRDSLDELRADAMQKAAGVGGLSEATTGASDGMRGEDPKSIYPQPDEGASEQGSGHHSHQVRGGLKSDGREDLHKGKTRKSLWPWARRKHEGKPTGKDFVEQQTNATRTFIKFARASKKP